MNNETKTTPKIFNFFKALLWILIILLLMVGPLTVSDFGNQTDKGIDLITYYVCTFCLFIIPSLVLMNFANIRNKLPLFRKKRFVTSTIAFVVLFIIMTLVASFFLSYMEGMYSESYKVEQARIQEQNEKAQAKLKEEKEQAAKLEAQKEEQSIQESSNHTNNEGTNNSLISSDKKDLDNIEQSESIIEADYDTDYAASKNVSIYSTQYLQDYIKENSIDFSYKKNQNKVEKILADQSDLIPVKLEKGRFSATLDENGDLFYAGKIKNNVPNGWGKIIRVVDASLIKNNGTLSVNVEGTYGWTGGEISVPILEYVGEFDNGYFDGYGWKYYSYDSYTFSSSCNNYVESTDELLTNMLLNCNPVEYMGEFKKGMFNGEGTMISYFPVGDSYIETGTGDFALLNVAPGEQIELYIGKYTNDMLKEAKHYLKGKLLYDGEYIDGKYHGEGKIYYLETGKMMYDGEWKYGLFHGKGTLYNEDGSIKYKGKWNKGDFAN